MRTVETLIVGGGPAGSSCAWELVRRGRECLVLERQELPKFKLCAGWITPEVVRSLELEPGSYPHGLLELKRIRVYFGNSLWRAAFNTRQYSVRRIEFDNWLLKRSGAEIVLRTVRSIVRDGEFFEVNGEFRCRYLVGAGGTRCPVKRALFAPDKGRLILTQEVEYETRPKDPVCTLFYPFAGWAGYAWYVPKAGAVNIGYGGVAEQFRDNVRSHWRGFVRTLQRRGLIDGDPPEPSGYPYYVGDRAKEVRRGNAFIVGDAAGLATVDLGEGIGPAVESGLAAAREIVGGGAYSARTPPTLTLPGLPGRLMSHFVLARR